MSDHYTVTHLEQPEPLLSLEEVSLSRRGIPGLLFDHLQLTLRPGERVAIGGDEGCGKSTLMRLMAGLTPPSAGLVRWRGKPATSWETGERAHFLGLLFRHPDQMFLTPRVGEEVALALEESSPEETREKIHQALSLAGLPPETARRETISLSAAQRSRVALAAVLAGRPRLLLVDEPGALLSEEGEIEMARTLHRLVAEEGMTTLIFTSRPSRALRFADRIYWLTEGCLFPHEPGPESSSTQHEEQM